MRCNSHYDSSNTFETAIILSFHNKCLDNFNQYTRNRTWRKFQCRGPTLKLASHVTTPRSTWCGMDVLLWNRVFPIYRDSINSTIEFALAAYERVTSIDVDISITWFCMTSVYRVKQGTWSHLRHRVAFSWSTVERIRVLWSITRNEYDWEQVSTGLHEHCVQFDADPQTNQTQLYSITVLICKSKHFFKFNKLWPYYWPMGDFACNSWDHQGTQYKMQDIFAVLNVFFGL